ncbi:MAG TPA: hypothetical protein VG455_04665 [Acidimicrobiales bacterium]|nr:hypothetical protein [Acidimicrobiales bacterium]
MFAGVGALMGSMNAGWLGLERDANAVFPLLGAGVLLVVASWTRRHWARKLWGAGLLGSCCCAACRGTRPVLGQLADPVRHPRHPRAFGIGLVLFAAVLWRRRLMATADV